MFKNRTVLISGGTGSFGHEATKVLLKLKPKKIIIFSRDELKQFEMSKKFQSSNMRFFLGDVRDLDRLNYALNGVDYVIHAAALKQVPAAEYNPTECIRTNIYGAENIIKASINNKVKKVMAISTDKAANPINLYGATKLASDKLFIAANNFTGGKKTMFSISRYGNVIGSRGSVFNFFREIIEKKINTFPITDSRMTRFWLELNDGIKFVLDNFYRMKGGEIFIPKIPSINILDLAKSLNPNFRAKIIGMRPGEKLHEILLPKDSSHHSYEFKDHYVIAPDYNLKLLLSFSKNNKGELGEKIKDGFEYNSLNNPHFLTIKQLKIINKKILL